MALFQQDASSNDDRTVSDTSIGAHVKITGTLSSDGNVQFDGMFESGEMNIRGCLTVGQTAKVNAKVKAGKLIVLGDIQGNVSTEGDVEIGSTGKVQGDLKAGGNLVINSGAVFIGKSVMNDSSSSDDENGRSDKSGGKDTDEDESDLDSEKDE